MRIKLTCILALKVRDSKAWGFGSIAAEALGWNENESQALKFRGETIFLSRPFRA
jgi:hypothetical protein